MTNFLPILLNTPAVKFSEDIESLRLALSPNDRRCYLIDYYVTAVKGRCGMQWRYQTHPVYCPMAKLEEEWQVSKSSLRLVKKLIIDTKGSEQKFAKASTGHAEDF